MKRFTTLVCALTFFYGFTQNAPIDFEVTGIGSDWTWTVFENDSNPPLATIPNPDPSGANTSSIVAEFTALQAGMPFAGVESAHGADLGDFVFDETNRTVKIMVWKSVISNVGIKFATATGWAEPEILVSNTVTGQWEELTFDFSNAQNPPESEGLLDQIIIFPDFDARTQDNIVYFDNITFSAGGGGGGGDDEPLTAAPTPTPDPENVISFYSDPYDDVPVALLTPWSVANFEEVQIEGNPTLKYTNVDFLGIETTGNPADVATQEFFHIDVWTPNMDVFRVKLVDFGPDGTFGGGDDTEHEIEFSELPQNQWNSLHIPMEDFVGLTTRNALAQVVLSGTPTGAGTLFVDNVYFTTEALSTNSNELSSLFSVYPNPASTNWNVVNKSNFSFSVDLFDVTGKLVSSYKNDGQSNLSIDARNLNTGIYFAKITTANASKTLKLIKK